MPTYDYHCDKCGNDFTVMHKMNEPAPACPGCGGPVIKKMAAPAVLGGGGSSPKSAMPQTHGCGAGACGCRH